MNKVTFETYNRTDLGVFYIEVTETGKNIWEGTTQIHVKIDYASEEATPVIIQEFDITDYDDHLIMTREYDHISVGTIAEFDTVIPHDDDGNGEANFKIIYHFEPGILQPIYTNNFIFYANPFIKNHSSFSREEIAYLIEDIAYMIKDDGESAIPWAFYQFPIGEIASSPFLIYYYDGNDDFVADNTNYAWIDNLVIELYTSQINVAYNDSIEIALNGNNLVYTKTFNYIESEEMYLYRYESEVLING